MILDRPAPTAPAAADAAGPAPATFLFTDIEGSTRRWNDNPGLMARELAHHDALLREVFAEQGGEVFKTVGDGFCVAFRDPTAAVRAAVDAQRRLAALPVGDLGPLRVRVALNAGPAEQREDDYFGPALNRVARLVGAGHGGQTLLSRAIAELAGGALPPGVELRDLGPHSLRDLPQPEPIFQLVVDGLDESFPPLRTPTDRAAAQLPAQATPLVGREREVEQASVLLRREGVAILTLTGPGGTGKTRLSLKIADSLRAEFPDGVYFVELGAIEDPALVLPEIARRIGLREAPERPLGDLLAEHLRGRRLLVLDNFEQVTAAGPAVADLVRACPTLKVIVSSRESLRVYGEQEYRVPPLSLGPRDPSPRAEELIEYEAVRLFVDRARAVRPDFALTDQNAPAIAEICRRVDGLPLAIELVATRIRTVAPEALLARMERRLPLLTGGSRDRPARQQTLRGAIAWSYDLLTEPERELVRRLGAFAGSFDVEAVAALCPGQYDFELLDTLDLLAAKSLVVADISGPATRYAMLQTIREFVLEQLRWSGEEEDVRQRHADHFLALAEQAEPMLRGGEQTTWSERLEQEHENLRAALEWLIQAGGAEKAWSLAGALYPFWSLRGYFGEARALLERAVEVGRDRPEDAASRARGKVLHVTGRLVQMTDPERARELYLESLAIRRSIDDPQGTASTLNQLGSIARYQGDYATAREMYGQALTILRALGDEWGATILLNNLGVLSRVRGEHAEARELSLESLGLARARRDEINTAIALDNLGEVEYEQHALEAASRHLEEGLTIQRRIGHRQGEAESLWALGNVARETGDHDLASRRYDEALAIWRETGYQRFIGLVQAEKSLLALDRGDHAQAQRLLQECAPMLHDLGERRYLAHALEALGALAAARGDADEAVALAAAATELRASIGAPRAPVDQARLDGWFGASTAGLTRAAERSAWSLGAVAPVGELIDSYRAPG